MNVNQPTFYSIRAILIATSIVADDLGITNRWPLVDKSENKIVDTTKEEKNEDTTKEEKNEDMSNDDKTISTKVMKPALRCNRCNGCSKPNCGLCFSCKDMLEFGGQNKFLQDCIRRHCIFFVFDEPKSPPENILEAVKERKEEVVEESDALGELFNTPDSDPLTGQHDKVTEAENDSEIELSQKELISSVFSLKGLVSMLEQECSLEGEKVQVLDSFCQRQSHPVYHIFQIINFAFSSGNINFLQSSGTWMEEAVKAVGRLLLVPVHHTFLRDTVDICHQFISFCLQSLAECPPILRENLCLLMSYLAGHKSLGKLLINGILSMFSTIADQLREASTFMCSYDEILDVFDNLMGLILQVWPKYIAQLIWMAPAPVNQTPKSKRRAAPPSKDAKPEVRKPKLSYTEASLLRQEIAGWRELLDNCTVFLSITQPQFCEGIWKIDTFCEGLLAKL